MNNNQMFKRASMISAAMFVLGILGWVASWAVLDKPPWAIFVALLALFTGMTQGPFVIAILVRTASAKWGARLYRITAIMALSFLPVATVMLLIVFAAKYTIIPWSAHSQDHFWYNPGFFFGRQAVYFALFYGLTYRLFKTSRLKGPSAEGGNHRLMILGLPTAVTFVLGATIFSWDLGMTLNHHYADTIYGAYYIMTSFFGGTAMTILLITFLNNANRSETEEDFFTPLHFQNLGTLATALTIVCFYGWWSQFFPIWYANLPEETNAIYLRIFSQWGVAYGIMMVFVSVIPFIALLFKRVRGSAMGLSRVAMVVLVGLWIQQYLYSAAPLINDGKTARLPVLSIPNIALTAGVLGAFLTVLFSLLRRYPDAYIAPLKGSEEDADYLMTQPEGW